MIIFKLIIRHKFSYVNKIVFIKIKWLKKLFRSKFWSEVSWSLDWYGRESLFKTLLTSFSDQKPKNILVANFMTWIIFKEIIPDRTGDPIISFTRIMVTFRNILWKCWHPCHHSWTIHHLITWRSLWCWLEFLLHLHQQQKY